VNATGLPEHWSENTSDSKDLQNQAELGIASCLQGFSDTVASVQRLYGRRYGYFRPQ
jgi:hypothetical protein